MFELQQIIDVEVIAEKKMINESRRQKVDEKTRKKENTIIGPMSMLLAEAEG